jgi:hypothetical protein
VQSCIHDSGFVVNNFIEAVRDFESQDAKKILDGLRLLGQGLQVLPDAITECQAAVQEAVILATKLTLVIKDLATPKTFVFHIGKDLIVNGKNIYREINTSVADWKTENYHDFGVQVGKALYDIFVGD